MRTKRMTKRMMIAYHHRMCNHWTYKKIGQSLGVSGERARQLVRLARIHIEANA